MAGADSVRPHRPARGALRAAILAVVALATTSTASARDFLLGIHLGFDSAALLAEAGGDETEAVRRHVDKAAALGARLVRIPADWR
ncbi:MAG TPA: hypothetical protein PLJ34_05255, partial [Hyphomicrobiales bacterium]|nr:hypothetical protein [Hyphomicrobiales bacterium]